MEGYLIMNQGSFKFLLIILSLFLGSSVLYAEPVRIMPLGDSITYENTVADLENPRPEGMRAAYRGYLWYNLQDSGYEADFVGSEIAGQDITPPFDPDNEGHPGWTSYELSEFTYDFLSENPADIVLLHIGTNDHGTSTAGVEQILDSIDLYEKDTGKSVQVFVAMIIDRKKHDRLIELFNENLKSVIGRRIKNGDHLTLVDMYHDAGLTSGDYIDPIHPNYRGFQKMAAVWTNALLSPYTPGLHAFPYTLIDQDYIDTESIVVDSGAQTVEFVTVVPDNGIIF
jgi:hypothetical protein